MYTTYIDLFRDIDKLTDALHTARANITTPTTPPEVHTRAPYGPKPPCNLHWLNTTIEAEGSLKELTTALAELLNTPPPHHRHTTWLYHKAGDIVDNKEANQLAYEDLATITRSLQPPTPATDTTPPTTWEAEHSILHKLKRLGYTTTSKDLHTLATRGHIEQAWTHKGKHYKLAQVVDYLTQTT